MKPGPGSLLIAPPAMTDTRFSKKVLLVTHNNKQGTFALCLNKPTKHTLGSISDQLDLPEVGGLPFSLHWGGPVNHGTIWMLHDNTWECDSTMYVNEHWRITSNESMFHHMLDGDCPSTFRLVFGYCSWAPGQLDMELSGTGPFSKLSSWVFTSDSDPDWVFEKPIEDLWEHSTELASNQAVDTWL